MWSLIKVYYFRNNLWSLFIPSYLLLLEMVLPIKMFLFPFLFMVNVFLREDSLNPFTKERIHLYNYPLVSVVKFNNVLILLTGVVAFFF